jgi:hypothetical protein
MDVIRAEGEAKIIERVASDEGFRKQLLSNPNAAIASVTGWQIPTNVTIKVVEESVDTFYLVVPFAETAGELSGEELEAVSGGLTRTCKRQTWTQICTTA